MCFGNTLKLLLKFQRAFHFFDFPIYFSLSVVAVLLLNQSIKILAQLTSKNVLIKTFNSFPMVSLKGSSKTRKNIQTSTALFQLPPTLKASVVGRFATAKTKARTTKSAKLFFMSSCMRCLTENLTVWIWRRPHNLSITESVGRILFWKPLFMQNENKRSVKKRAHMKSLLQMNLQAIKV